MKKFLDSRTEQIYLTGAAPGVPKHVGRMAWWSISLIQAAHERYDLEIIGATSGTIGYEVALEGKWHVTFDWQEGYGAHSIKVERL